MILSPKEIVTAHKEIAAENREMMLAVKAIKRAATEIIPAGKELCSGI